MELKESIFIGSFPNYKKCPENDKPEYAFIGRSNVGKSSLINMLTGRKELARVSKKPGKTEHLNFYLIDNEWYIVDLPGYGYAQKSKKLRHSWRKMIEDYLTKRGNLQCAFILIDSNIPPQKNDIDFINWMGEHQIPFVIAYTKTDKLKKAQLNKNVEKIQAKLLEYWNELPQQFITSSVSNLGKDDILEFIKEVNNRFFPENQF